MFKSSQSIMHIGIKGTVLALNRLTGEEIWRQKLKGGDFVHLVQDGDNLFATTRGEIYCLSASTGAILWNNPLKGMGYGLVSIASPAGGMILSAAEIKRQQAAAAAAAGAAA